MRYKKRIERLKFWLKALVHEHHLVNLVWKNYHSIDDRLYRSAQLMPHDLRRIVRRVGIKTVVNLRGPQKDRAVYRIEKAVCRSLGVRMVDVEIYSRSLLDERRLKDLKQVFDTIEYPALIHCKAGADRSSLAAVLYLYERGVPLEEAMRRQMRFWPFGYIAASKAGIMRYYFERYLADGQNETLLQWTRHLDRQAIERDFAKYRQSAWVDWFYDNVLRRE